MHGETLKFVQYLVQILIKYNVHTPHSYEYITSADKIFVDANSFSRILLICKKKYIIAGVKCI